MEFIGLPSIEGFHNAVKAVDAYPHLAPTPIAYRGKIKLHGTCAGVRVVNGQVLPMSRTTFLTVTQDNAGFAKWVETNLEFWKALGAKSSDITVFGEWCGPGIMKKTAIQQIPEKIFAVFGILEGNNHETATFLGDPAQIAAILGPLPPRVHILPWEGDEFVVNFQDRASLQPIVDALNAKVAQIEPCDPWVKSVFGVEGICEGIVYYPSWNTVNKRKHFSDLAFKAKGEKHKTNKTDKAVQIDPEVAKSIEEFVAMFATEARFEQGAAVVGEGPLGKVMPEFLKWVSLDVMKESADELEASELEWSQVAKPIASAARTWFLERSKKISV